MKKILSIVPVLCVLAVIYVASTLISCKKDDVLTAQEQPGLTGKGSVDYTNPNPTWIQVTSPLLQPAKWSAYFVPLRYTAGIQTSYKNTVTTTFDTVVVRWHLHVGLRNFNSLLKPDVIDRSFYYINGGNGGEQYSKPIPNGGVMGDYDIVDVIRIPKTGYYNGYSLGSGFNWDGITPEIHSSATNGWLSSPFFIGTPIK